MHTNSVVKKPFFKLVRINSAITVKNLCHMVNNLKVLDVIKIKSFPNIN